MQYYTLQEPLTLDLRNNIIYNHHQLPMDNMTFHLSHLCLSLAVLLKAVDKTHSMEDVFKEGFTWYSSGSFAVYFTSTMMVINLLCFIADASNKLCFSFHYCIHLLLSLQSSNTAA